MESINISSQRDVLFSPVITILLIALLAAFMFTHKLYQSPVTPKSYLLGIYLYVFISALLIALFSKLIAMYIPAESKGQIVLFMILYILLALSSFSTMAIAQSPFYRHIGLAMLLLAMSLLFSLVYDANNMVQAAAITSLIVFAITSIVFYSSEENLIKMRNWLPSLTVLLCGLIVIHPFR